MGMGSGGSGGGSSRFRGTYRPVSDINVTPFIDIMLVLLLVFMITAPLLTSGVNVNLPQTEAAPLTIQDAPIVITLTADRRLYIQNMAVDAKDMVSKLEAITNRNRDTTLFIRADSGISYGHVMGVMGMINSAGFSKVALVSAPTSTST